MGEEISRTSFISEDHERFTKRLRAETALVQQWFEDGRFSESGFTLGFELEGWLLDEQCYPSSVNEQVIEALGDPRVVPELSRFNVEFNCTPQPMTGAALCRAEAELTEVWRRCNEIASRFGAHVVLIGTLPTIREEDLTLANMSPLNRYYALNREVFRQRHGTPIRIDIEGREHLTTDHRDVMLEAATTSFQIHLKTPASLAHRYLNAAAMVSAPILAASANSPFVFGKTLWEETRIPLFEQSVAIGGALTRVKRVTFGRDYIESSLLALLRENLDDYTILLPLCVDESPEALHHLKLHNGTIWRWNRPLVGSEEDGAPHLRVEHRILPSGPTFVDMMANAALYVGLVHEFVATNRDDARDLSFADARNNFYAAARDGLRARLSWPSREGVEARQLLLDELIPAARKGLSALGIDAHDCSRYLDIVEARVLSGQTGSAWQRECFAANGGDFRKLMASYSERQQRGRPVHEWDY